MARGGVRKVVDLYEVSPSGFVTVIMDGGRDLWATDIDSDYSICRLLRRMDYVFLQMPRIWYA